MEKAVYEQEAQLAFQRVSVLLRLLLGPGDGDDNISQHVRNVFRRILNLIDDFRLVLSGLIQSE
ncbi:hypothetical protein D3C72_2309550 [compost metagenome]